MQQRRCEIFLQKLVFVVLAFMAVSQIIVQRGLMADTPNFFINILLRKNFALWDPHRWVSNIVQQFPVVMAIKAGCRDIHSLAFIFSTWLLAAPVLIWALALWKARDEKLFWVILALFSFSYFNSGFFAICEYNLCFALVGLNLALLLGAAPITRRTFYWLFPAAALLCLSYASTIYFGALLMLIALLQLRQEKNHHLRFYYIALAAIYFLAALSGLWEVLTPRDASNFAQARNILILAYMPQFWLCLASLSCAALALTRTHQAAGYVCAAIACAFALCVLNPAWQSNPGFEYNMRAFVSHALFLLSCGAAWWVLKRNNQPKTEAPRWNFIAPVFLLFLILAAIDVRTSWRLDQFLNQYRVALATHTGDLAFEESAGQFQYVNLFGSSWTNPVLSLMLRDNTHEALMQNPAWYHGFQPFDKHMPDLGDYHY